MGPKPNKFKNLLSNLGYIDNVNDNSKVLNLLSIPRKDTRYETPHTYVPTAQYIHQIDLLFLPFDKTVIKSRETKDKADLKKVNAIRIKENPKAKPFKKAYFRYLLVCVDIGTGLIDCEPLKFKYSFIVRDALKAIYKRKILKVPHEIEVDAGVEFQSEFLTYFNSVSHVRKKMSGRHRAQAVVESVNGILSKIIQTRMTAEEINTYEAATEWVEDIPFIVKEYNKAYSHDPVKIDPKNDIPIKVNPKNSASDIVPNGTPVRIQLDNPISSHDGSHLHGKFRAGDIRFQNKIRHVTQLYLRPNQPPMYKVDDLDVAFTKKQLQIVRSDEVKPSSKAQKKQTIDRILEKLKIKNKIHYKILWTDKSITNEPRTSLIDDVPDLIDEFEKNLKLHNKGITYIVSIKKRFKEKNKIFFEVVWSDNMHTNESRIDVIKIAPRLVTEYEHLLKASK